MPKKTKPTIIAVGASAGGLEAIQDLLSNISKDLKSIAIVVAQHLSPSHKSMLVQLLSRGSQFTVVIAEHGLEIKSGVVYVIPPDTNLEVIKWRLQLTKAAVIGPKPSINLLFESLSSLKTTSARIGIVLSGTGTDGSAGLAELHRSGGITIVQDPNSAKYDGMPRSAIETYEVDAVALPSQMGVIIEEYLKNTATKLYQIKPDVGSDKRESGLNHILHELSKKKGTKFSNYKLSSISRRIKKRMSTLKIDTIDDYVQLIKTNPDELDLLYQVVLIGVTEFFRDRDAFVALETQLKRIIDVKPEGEPLRIWVAGCATGEEPYTIGIILQKLLGNRFVEYPIQIFATDIDELALQKARKGLFDAESIKKVPEEQLQIAFANNNEQYEIAKSIRAKVLFSIHDLTNQPPYMKLDLVSCRNLLIYFDTILQKQIIPIFQHALLPNGILFLGKSESIGSFSNLFSTVDSANKIYKRNPGKSISATRYKTRKPDVFKNTNSLNQGETTGLSKIDRLRNVLFTAYSYPHIYINDNFDLVEIHGDVSRYLHLTEGVVNVNALKMVVPEIQIELHRAFTDCMNGNIPVVSRPIRLTSDERHVIRLRVMPLFQVKTTELIVVYFEDLELGSLLPLPSTIDADNVAVAYRVHELETELNATREHLQTFIQELETTNEELQALNEEMQSTNEEMQSTNEELETTNEELQSTNEEIQTAYNELRIVHDELERKELIVSAMNARYESIVEHSWSGFMLINQNGRIVDANDTSSRIFGYLIDELSGMWIGQLLDAKRSAIDAIFSTLQSVGRVQTEFTGLRKDSSRFSLELSAVQFYDELHNEIRVSVLLSDQSNQKKLETLLHETNQVARIGGWSLELAHNHLDWTDMTKELHEVDLDYKPDVETAINFYSDGESRKLISESIQQCIESGLSYDLEVMITTAKGNKRWVRTIGKAEIVNESTVRIYGTSQDIHNSKMAIIEREQLIKELSTNNDDLKQFTYITSHNLRGPLTNLMAISSLLTQIPETNPESLVLIEGLNQSTLQLNNTLNDLVNILVIKQSTQIQTKMVDFSSSLDAVYKSLSVLLTDNDVEIKSDFESAPSVDFLPAYIESIMLNLITNAIKYRSTSRKPVIEIKSYVSDRKVFLEIRDNGIGMDMNKVKDKIFKLYQRFSTVSEGKGMGLYLVKSEVEALGGTINVQSELDKGTVFTIEFANRNSDYTSSNILS